MKDRRFSCCRPRPRVDRRPGNVSAMVAALILATAISAWADDRRRIVEFQPGTSDAMKTQIVQDSGSTLLRLLPIVNAASIELPPAPDTQVAEAYLLSQAEVKAVHQDALIKAQSEETEGMESSLITPAPAPAAGSLWNLLQIDHDQVPSGIEGAGVQIAVLDTGIDTSHPALAGVVIGGYNAVTGSGASQAASGEGGDGEGGDGEGGDSSAVGYSDCNGHGTHVAGIIAGSTTGVAPQAKLHAVRVLDCAGGGYVSDLISGLSWVYDYNANIDADANIDATEKIDVINMSLGYYKDGGYPLLRQAIETLHNAGVVLVASGGNYRSDCLIESNNLLVKLFNIIFGGCNTRVKFPARYKETLTVAASNMQDKMAYYSIPGPTVDITAPGGTLLQPVISATSSESTAAVSDPAANGEGGDGEGGDGIGAYGGGSGTSMAAPHVAGVVALMLSANPALTPQDVQTILQVTADDIGAPSSAQGHGRVNAANAVISAQSWAAGDNSDPVTSAPSIGSDTVIDTSAIIGDSTTLGDRSQAGAGSHIMDNTTVQADVTVGTNVTIGEGSLIKENTNIGNNVDIGHHSTIEQGVNIGNLTDSNMYGTRLGDNVQIKSNVRVSKLTLTAAQLLDCLFPSRCSHVRWPCVFSANHVVPTR